MLSEKLIIAGPCALESRSQLQECVRILKALQIKTIRASLWKPRTQPGWEGLGAAGLPLLLEETLPYGMQPATEVISADHAALIVQTLANYGEEARMLVWLGARNQNHMEQKKIAQLLAQGPKGISLMFKNQMWYDEEHWLGIYEHILSQGFPQERLLICHRGFCPGPRSNPHGWRNVPDFELAMRIKEKTRLPMLFDPSHIAGARDRVAEIYQMALQYDFDGYLIEMHHDPEKAKTDIDQQLFPSQLEDLLHFSTGYALR